MRLSTKKVLWMLLILAVPMVLNAANTYYVDPVGGNDDSAGSSTSTAWKTFRNIFCYRGDKAPALSYASHLVSLSAGDIVYILDGTINTVYRPGDDSGAANVTGRPGLMTFNGLNGTVSAPIRLAAYPGASPVLDPQYQGEGIYIYQCNYVEISGITIYEATTTVYGEGGGIAIESSNHIKVHGVTVYDTDGTDNGNMSGLHCLSSSEIEIDSSTFYDNYDRSASDSGGITTANSTNLVFFGGGNISVHDCLISETQPPLATNNTGGGIKYKAASSDPAAYFNIYNNVFRNCKFFSVTSGTGNTHVYHNIFIGGNVAVEFADEANYTRLMNEVVEDNTIVNTQYSSDPTTSECAFSFYPTLYWNDLGYPGSVSNIVFRNNIVYDSGSYASEHAPVYMYGYIDDTLYNASLPEMHISNNCYFNSAGNPLEFSVAYKSSPGAVLGGVYDWTQWRALTWTNPSTLQTQALNFDAGSVNIDPHFMAVDAALSKYDPSSNVFRPVSGSPAENMGAYANLTSITPVVSSQPAGLIEAYVYPNPAKGQNPVLRVMMGVVDSLEITIFDGVGRLVHSVTLPGAPTGVSSDGNPYYDYTWTEAKASGVYFAVIHGKTTDGKTVKARVKFTVVR